MIVPDVNLLLYAFNSGSPHYNAARRWWEGLVNGTEQVGLPWAVIISFIRLVPPGADSAYDDGASNRLCSGLVGLQPHRSN